MKFKYKKMIIMISMGAMFIGCVLFSTVGTKGNKEKKTVTTVEEAAPENTEEVEVKEEEVTSIVKDLNTEVSAVVKQYLRASVACDMEALEDTVNNISYVDEKALRVKYEYIEGVNNIECYMIPGPEKDGYLVYIYRELKIKDVETLAPGLSRVYVKEGDNGEYRVYFGEDTGLENFINEVDQSAEVIELVNKVNSKMEELVSADADLKAFMERISNASNPSNASDNSDE